jgi:hypothetical protein
MKCRVIEKTRRDGSTYYYAQYKTFLFWHYIKRTIPAPPYEDIPRMYDTFEEAQQSLKVFKEQWETSHYREKTKKIDVDV